MAALTTHELEDRLLTDPACPWSVIHRAQNERGMSVRTLRKFAEERGLDPNEVEEAMDQYTAEHGGKRQSVIRPFHAVPNLLRRLRGQQPETDDIWRIARPG